MPLTLNDVEEFALALNLPVDQLLMAPDHLAPRRQRRSASRNRRASLWRRSSMSQSYRGRLLAN
jgi:hypothetical protein